MTFIRKKYHYCETPKYLKLRQHFEKVFPRVNASSSMKYNLVTRVRGKNVFFILQTLRKKHQLSICSCACLLRKNNPVKEETSSTWHRSHSGSETLSLISFKNKPACQSLQTEEYTKRKYNNSRAFDLQFIVSIV